MSRLVHSPRIVRSFCFLSCQRAFPLLFDAELGSQSLAEVGTMNPRSAFECEVRSLRHFMKPAVPNARVAMRLLAAFWCFCFLPSAATAEVAACDSAGRNWVSEF